MPLVEESFRGLTVHNTTQSMTTHQVIVLCCDTVKRDILCNYHRWQAPTTLVGQIALKFFLPNFNTLCKSTNLHFLSSVMFYTRADIK